MSFMFPITKQDLSQLNPSFFAFSPSKQQQQQQQQQQQTLKLPNDSSPFDKVININGNQTYNINCIHNDDECKNIKKISQRKRKFDVMLVESSLSSSLANTLSNAPQIRISNLTMLYVRIIDNSSQISNYKNDNQKIGDDSSGSGSGSESGINAFHILMSNQKNFLNNISQNNNNNSNNNLPKKNHGKKKSMEIDDDNNNNNNAKKPNLIGICDEWVETFDTFEKANDKQWLSLNPEGKIHEYQIQNWNGIFIIDLNNQSNLHEINDCQSIRSYIFDQNLSGYTINGKLFLHKPFSYWRLVDDSKKKGISQCLIKDMFLIQSIHERSNNDNNQNKFNIVDTNIKRSFEF